MANKCCSCSRFLSCLSCFSRGNDPDALPPAEGTASSDVLAVMGIPSVGTSSSAIEEENVDVDLDALVKHISNLLEQMKDGTKSSQKKTKTAQQYLPTTSKSFIKLKEFLSEAANFVKDIVPGDAIKTVASGILQGMGMAHLATAGLVVVASILERVDDVSANKTECLRLLSEMIFLAKLVKQFKERSQLKETMHAVIREATELVVESSIKCLGQMKSSKFSKDCSCYGLLWFSVRCGRLHKQMKDFPPLDVSLDYFVFLSQWTKNWGFGVSRTIFAAGESAMKNPVKLHENRI